MINNIEEFETALRRLNAICDVPFRIEILEDELLEYVRGLEQNNQKYNTFDLDQLISFGYYVRKNSNNTLRENYYNWKKDNAKQQEELNDHAINSKSMATDEPVKI